MLVRQQLVYPLPSVTDLGFQKDDDRLQQLENHRVGPTQEQGNYDELEYIAKYYVVRRRMEIRFENENLPSIAHAGLHRLHIDACDKLDPPVSRGDFYFVFESFLRKRGVARFDLRPMRALRDCV